jgi:hypothetical protein
MVIIIFNSSESESIRIVSRNWRSRDNLQPSEGGAMHLKRKAHLDPIPIPKPEDPLPMPDEPIPDPDIPTPGPA